MQRMIAKTLLVACLVALSSEWAAAQSGMASLRVRCDGDSLGTGVSINGQFKGECPFDAMVPEGTLKIEARKEIGKEYVRVFEQEIRVGAGIIKSVEVLLGKEQLTAEGRRLHEERTEAQRRAQAEREQAERQRAQERYEKRSFATEMLRLQHDARLEARLRARSAEPGTAFPHPECQECRLPVGSPKPFPETFWTPMQWNSVEDAKTINRLLVRMRAYVIGNRQAFVPPTDSLALQCGDVNGALRRAGGLMSQDDMTMDEWKRGGDLWKAYWRDLRIWIVSGQCSPAGLHGPVEFWFKGIHVAPKLDSHGIDYDYVSHLGYVRAFFSEGQPTGMVEVSRRTINLWMSRGAQDDYEEFTVEEREPLAPHLAQSARVWAFLPSNRLPAIDRPSLRYSFFNGAERNAARGE